MLQKNRINYIATLLLGLASQWGCRSESVPSAESDAQQATAASAGSAEDRPIKSSTLGPRNQAQARPLQGGKAGRDDLTVEEAVADSDEQDLVDGRIAEATTGSTPVPSREGAARRPLSGTTGLAELVAGDNRPFEQNRMQIDDERVAANGIRKMMGRHIDLYTDLPHEQSVNDLTSVFDQAVDFWREYFDVSDVSVDDWRVTGMVIQDKSRFMNAGLFPDTLPEFEHGYSRGFEFWVYEQPEPYYRRHLVLHEGTHAFMFRFLGGGGPPWYSEGISELLACHRWSDSKLTMNCTIPSAGAGAGWGRVKIVRDAFAAGQAKTLSEILWYGWDAHLQIEPYGWCWAACAFFEHHPDYQDRFAELRKEVNNRSETFNERFLESLSPQWREIQEQWQLFVSEIDYGYDVAAAAIEYGTGQLQPAEGQAIKISSRRGWQSSGIQIESGKSYEIIAEGRYQVGDHPSPWWCEPNGVTIDYHRGQPLGILLAAVGPATDEDSTTPLLDPRVIGKRIELRARRSGTLFLRVNESPARLEDNRGDLVVQVIQK